MRKLYSVFAILLVLFACSKEEEVITPPAPNKYTITITAEAGGTVSSPGGTYNEGSKITITATPDGQYLFEKWSDGSTVNPREITVTANLTLSATFVKKTYPLSVTVEGEGTVQEEVIIQGSTSQTEHKAGTTVRLTATPNEGWIFSGWSGDVESEEKVIEVAIEKGTSVSALFKRSSFELNITIVGEGTVTEEVIVQPSQYDFETFVRLTAVPAEGQKFIGWSGGVISEENPIEIEVQENIEITASFESAIFVSTAERFSPINETTGYFSKINSFLRYLSLDEGRYFTQLYNNDLFDNFDAISHDFNDDGYLDLLLFSMNERIFAYPFGTGSHANGKYYIIPNYFNQSPPYNIYEYNSVMEFAGGGMDLQDLNGDGRKEVLIYNDNDHQYNTGFIADSSINPPSLLGIVVLDIDENFNIVSESILGTPKNLHRGSTGDIDNDGDIDVLNFPMGDPRHETRFQNFPTILYNNGNGSFNEELIFKDQSFEDYYHSLSATAVNFFDVDGDGNLDLIFGYRFGTPPEPFPIYYGVNWYFYENGYTDTFVLWGDGSGKYSFDNKTALSINNELNFQLTLMGMGFSDFDKDGDVDVFLQATRTEVGGQIGDGTYYYSYILYLLENKGNRVFEDETVSKIDGYYHIENVHLGDMGEMMAIDKNNDGWIDLVPKDVKIYCCANTDLEYVSNLWWENVGGSFVRRIED